tara:strand:- start:1485 stop:2063 length:579 start_codon:yes stop_codon:yes gene_type:complete
MRKVYAPYSQSGENVAQTPLEGYIEIEQIVQPTIETGFVNENGLWIGNVSSDAEFTIHNDGVEIANTANFITPSVNADGTWPLDMTGFSDVFIALKPTNGGNYAIQAVMGPDSLSFANLSPVNAAAKLRGHTPNGVDDMRALLDDGAESLTADVWNIFIIAISLANQKLLQFNVTNNSGDISTIETAFMRLV